MKIEPSNSIDSNPKSRITKALIDCSSYKSDFTGEKGQLQTRNETQIRKYTTQSNSNNPRVHGPSLPAKYLLQLRLGLRPDRTPHSLSPDFCRTLFNDGIPEPGAHGRVPISNLRVVSAPVDNEQQLPPPGRLRRPFLRLLPPRRQRHEVHEAEGGEYLLQLDTLRDALADVPFGDQVLLRQRRIYRLCHDGQAALLPFGLL